MIRYLFSYSPNNDFDPLTLLAFALIWYFMTISTYGVWVPAGLFLPGIIIGGAIGRLYTMGIDAAEGGTPNISALQHNALLGASGMLAGYCRLTYCLTVIMLETAQNIDMFIPMMLTIIVAFGTAQCFNKSLYMRALRTKQVPFLTHKIPKENRAMRAKVVMSCPPITLRTVARVGDIFAALKKEKAYFPVLNQTGILVGRVSANFLIKLIECKCWYTDVNAGLDEIVETEGDIEDTEGQGVVESDDLLTFQKEVERGVSEDDIQLEQDLKL